MPSIASRSLISEPSFTITDWIPVAYVSEKFTGIPGTYVPLAETIRGFKEIIEGKHDDLPESAFLYVGTIDEAVEKAKRGAR